MSRRCPRTLSPSPFSHDTIFPSVIVLLSAGMKISRTAARGPHDEARLGTALREPRSGAQAPAYALARARSDTALQLVAMGEAGARVAPPPHLQALVISAAFEQRSSTSKSSPSARLLVNPR